MIGVPGTAHRLFGALRDAGISVILISQGSSEHSICFAIPAAQAQRADEAVRRAFDAELRDGQIQRVDVARDLSDSRRRRRRHGRRTRRGRQGVQFAGRCRDQRAGDRSGRLRAQHLAGGGRQGRRQGAACGARRLLSVAEHALDRLDRPRHRRAGTAGADRESTRSPAGVEAGSAGARHRRLHAHAARGGRRSISRNWPRCSAEKGEPLDLEKFAAHVQADYIPHTALIDCTASAEVASRYRDWLARGIHVVTPNKKANSGALPALSRAQGGGTRRRHPLSLRGDRGCRPAGHPHAARLARDGR